MVNVARRIGGVDQWHRKGSGECIENLVTVSVAADLKALMVALYLVTESAVVGFSVTCCGFGGSIGHGGFWGGSSCTELLLSGCGTCGVIIAAEWGLLVAVWICCRVHVSESVCVDLARGIVNSNLLVRRIWGW